MVVVNNILLIFHGIDTHMRVQNNGFCLELSGLNKCKVTNVDYTVGDKSVIGIPIIVKQSSVAEDEDNVVFSFRDRKDQLNFRVSRKEFKECADVSRVDIFFSPSLA